MFYYCFDTHLSLFLLSLLSFYAGRVQMKLQSFARREGSGQWRTRPLIHSKNMMNLEDAEALLIFFSKLIEGRINVCVGEVGNSGGGAIMPAVANKTTFSNIVHTTSGGSCKWLPHVAKLILEMIANHTHPRVYRRIFLPCRESFIRRLTS